MPRVLVLADCDPELGDRPIVLEEALGLGAFKDRRTMSGVVERVLLAVARAEEVERRVSALYG
jgi:hypothetical protein